MKIAFSGAHSSGKTTLAQHVAQVFNLRDETDWVVKKFIPKYGKPQETIEGQWTILNFWVQTVSQIKEGFVIDRSPLDHIVYARLFKCSNSIFERTALNSINWLDHVFVTQPVIMVEDENKFRPYGSDIQTAYQDEMSELLFRGVIRNVTFLPSYGLDELKSFTEQIIRRSSWSNCKDGKSLKSI